MAAYRVFTRQDCLNARDYIGPRNSPYEAFCWNNWWNNNFHVYVGNFGIRITDRNDYANNPTKLILRRHIYIQSIDGTNFPDV